MRLFASERRSKILDLLNEHKRITVKQISEELGVSEATLRADLNKMEKDELLTRTHGGAILNEDSSDTSFSERSKRNLNEKRQIAKHAYKLIKDRQCILLDASSTALELAKLINVSDMNLTVVTTGALTAIELKDNANITVILIGGVLTNNSTSIEGLLGIDILNHVNIDTMFTSGYGLSIEKGLTDFNIYEVELKKELVKTSDKVIALIDSSKIDNQSSSSFATIEEINCLITDKPLSSKLENNLTNKINVIYALN